MSWLKRSEPHVVVGVKEVRLTQAHLKIHKVVMEVSASGQRYASQPAEPQPVDPVSHRYGCRWPGAEIEVPLIPWSGAPCVKIHLWNKRRRRKTLLGMLEYPIASVLNPGICTEVTEPVSATLFVNLHIKVDLKIEVFASPEEVESWKLIFENHLTPPPDPQEYLTPPPSDLVSSKDSGMGSPLDSGSYVSSSATSLVPSTDTQPLKQKKKFNFAWDVGSAAIGVVYLEIVSVRNLPRFRTLTGLSFDMDPFIVISFGKKTFRTPYIRHTTNPTFDQKLLFLVDKHEANYDVTFTIWDNDRITLNDKVAHTSISMPEIINHGPRIDPATGLYDLNSYNPITLSLPCDLCDTEHVKRSSRNSMNPELLLNVHYLPYAGVRQRLWRAIIDLYDVDDANALNFSQLTAMLNSLGSTLKPDRVKGFFTRFHPGSDPATDSVTLTVDQIIICIEDHLKEASTTYPDNASIMTSSTTALTSLSSDRLNPQAKATKDRESAVERVIFLRVCPLCQKPQLGKHSELDSMRHISLCASKHWSDSDTVLLDGRYVTRHQASRRWYSKFLSKCSFGSYKLGANSANILVQDRMTGQIDEEKMSAAVRLGIRLLYTAAPVEAKRIQRILRKYTLRQGIKYDSPASATSIKPFIKFHNLDMTDVLGPLSSFTTFNEFFYRKLNPGSRPCENADEPRTVVSMADCRLSLFPTVTLAKEIWIKGNSFSIDTLIGDTYPGNVSMFVDGSLAVFRLAPQDYHRFHSPVDGIVGDAKHIPGHYYTVNPMAVRSTLDVYGQNARTVVPIDSPQFGRVMVVLIGAMMVGSIVVTPQAGTFIHRTDELGYFKFGGSTAVVLFEQGRVVFDSDLLANSATAIETLVKVGMSIGHTPDIPEYTRTYDTRKEAIKRAHTDIAGGGSYMPFSLD